MTDDKPTERSIELKVAQTMLDRKADRADEILHRDKTTGTLTDEQIYAIARNYGVLEDVPNAARSFARRIEAIVRERAAKDHCESCESNLAEDGQCNR